MNDTNGNITGLSPYANPLLIRNTKQPYFLLYKKLCKWTSLSLVVSVVIIHVIFLILLTQTKII